MKQAEIKIGHVYAAKITDKVVPVRIDAERISLSSGKPGGWDGTNVTTNRKVVIKSAAKLRKELPSANLPPAPEADKPATTSGGPVKKKLSTAERRPAAQANATSAKPTTDSEPADTPQPTPPQEKRLSLIDAAAQVLAASGGDALNSKQMVERITEAGLWSPRNGGKTPHATLYSAILREVQTKGAAARFTKTERGHFNLNKSN